MDDEQGNPSLLEAANLEGDAALEVEYSGQRSAAEQWKETLKRIINCVVVLKVVSKPCKRHQAGDGPLPPGTSPPPPPTPFRPKLVPSIPRAQAAATPRDSS